MDKPIVIPNVAYEYIEKGRCARMYRVATGLMRHKLPHVAHADTRDGSCEPPPHISIGTEPPTEVV